MVQEHFGAHWQTLQPSLRIYDITGLAFDGSSAGGVSELPLPQGESCFLSGFRPGTRYIADLGIVSGYGQFMPLLRSNAIETPPLSHATYTEPQATPSTYPVSFTVIEPFQYEQFSAYSVYPLKTADSEPGGDTD